MGSFQYLFAFGKGGMGGVRYAGTIEPTWHATEHFSLGVGIGFGGLVEPNSGRPNPPDRHVGRFAHLPQCADAAVVL